MAKRGRKPKSESGEPKKGPRSQALPGMKKIRNVELDNLCEAIGEAREQMNAARTEEGEYIESALKTMRATKIHTYKHAGVELARVPGGDEKLRVRLVPADKGDAEVSEATEVEAAEAEGETVDATAVTDDDPPF